MINSIILFILYNAICLFFLYLLSRKKNAVLKFNESTLAFAAKIIAGCFYGYFFLHLYNGDSDTWIYHTEGLKEFALLKSHPADFLTNGILPQDYKANQLNTIFDSSHSYVKDLELTLLFKLLAIFDVFSGGNYYVNVIFFDAIVFVGCYWLFKIFSLKYPEKRTLWLLIIFYLPATLFWTSGIRKDGISFSIICGLIYQVVVLFEKKFSGKRIVLAFCLFALLFLIRNYLAVTFIPVVIAYAISKRNKNALAVFSMILLICAAGFFFTSAISNNYNLPLKMAERQHSFLLLKGGSYLPIDSLDGTFSSYIKILPTALNHVFVRPHFNEANNILYLFSLINSIFFFVVLIRIFIKPDSNFKTSVNSPFLLSLITIALLNYIIIGYTVPFLGAIVRYKASFEIFFILAFFILQKDPLLIFQKKKQIIE